MIYIQSYLFYDSSPFKDCSGNLVNRNAFINMAKVSNYLLNKTGKEIHFWGCEKSIDFVKSIGLKYHKYFEIPKNEQQKMISLNEYFDLNKMYVASVQEQKFYMVDLDFFLFQNLEEPCSKKLYVQHYEWHSLNLVEKWIRGVDILLKKYNLEEDEVSSEANKLIKFNDINYMYNLGIVGGCGQEIGVFYSKLYKFLTENKNIKKMIKEIDHSHINFGSFNPQTEKEYLILGKKVLAVLMVQIWLPALCRKYEFEIKELWKRLPPPNEWTWVDFSEKNIAIGFSHLIHIVPKNDPKNIKNLIDFMNKNGIPIAS